jgi:hypothetical protein
MGAQVAGRHCPGIRRRNLGAGGPGRGRWPAWLRKGAFDVGGCSVCEHPKSPEIDGDLREGARFRGENLRKHEARDAELPETLRGLDEIEAELRSIAKEDGYVLKRPPGRHSLFERYLEGPGYSLFWTLSEIASHPGPVYLVLLHRDPETRRINVDLESSHVERSYWSAMAYDLLGRTCDVATELFGWQSWRQQTVLPLVREAVPDLKEAVRRWTDRWGIPSPGLRGDGDGD